MNIDANMLHKILRNQIQVAITPGMQGCLKSENCSCNYIIKLQRKLCNDINKYRKHKVQYPLFIKIFSVLGIGSNILTMLKNTSEKPTGSILLKCERMNATS